jgi:hypothetical protein
MSTSVDTGLNLSLSVQRLSERTISRAVGSWDSSLSIVSGLLAGLSMIRG